MKFKTLILALPALCFACGTPTSPSDPAFQADASQILAKHVTGSRSLVNDFQYEDPCHILGEDYVKQLFNLDEKTEVTESHGHNGCEFEWAGNKVVVSFGDSRPFSSLEKASYAFDKLQTGGAAEVAHEHVATDSTHAEAEVEHTAHAVSAGNYIDIEELGDKAVWDASTGTMHVLYINNIINVTVENKSQAAQKKKLAESLVGVIIEKINDNHYVKYL